MKAEIGFDVSQIIGSNAVLSQYSELSSNAIIPGADLAVKYAADDLTKASSATTSNGDLGMLSVFHRVLKVKDKSLDAFCVLSTKLSREVIKLNDVAVH